MTTLLPCLRSFAPPLPGARLLAATLAACLGGGFACPARAQDTLYYAVTDGTVRAIDVTTGAETQSIPATAFNGGFIGAAREIAFDPATRLLWYADTDNSLRTLHVGTLAAGPTIPGSVIPGPAVGAGRHLSIDYPGRRLLVPIVPGGVQMFSLVTLEPVGQIPAATFAGAFVGGYLHLASEPRSGNAWFASSDGSLREIHLGFMVQTGNAIAAGLLQGANPGAFRHFAFDPARNLLVYAVTDGSVASLDLSSRTPGPIALPNSTFAGANPGSARTITTDGSFPTAAVATFGSGCPGSAGPPALGPEAGSRPRLGQTFVLQAVPATGFALLQLGVQRLPVPLSLAVLGAPGCSVFVSMDVGLGQTGAPAPDRRTFSLPLPSNQALLGAGVFGQAFVLDPPANLLGLVASNAVQVLLGRW